MRIPTPLKRHIEFIRFLFTGAWNTLFGYGVFVALYYLPPKLHFKLHYIVIAVLSNILAITNAYICYKLFVFRTRGNYLREYLRFYLIYGATALIGIALLPLMVEVLSIHPVISQGILLAGTMVVSFFGHKHFSFRKSAVESGRSRGPV